MKRFSPAAGRAWARALAVAAIIVFAPTGALAAEAFIVDVVREGGGDSVNISATLKGAFTPEIKESIASGAPVVFTYFIQLKRHRAVIWNETVRKLVIERMVKFDTLTKDYLTWEKRAGDQDEIDFKRELEKVEFKNEPAGESRKQKEDTEPRDNKNNPETVLEPVQLKKSSELEKWMTHLEKIGLGKVEGLEPNARHYARVRCTMKSVKLIPPFNYILFFISLWDFDTDWTSSTAFTISVKEPSSATEPDKPAPKDTP